jgi:hypothetical protein
MYECITQTMPTVRTWAIPLQDLYADCVRLSQMTDEYVFKLGTLTATYEELARCWNYFRTTSEASIAHHGLPTNSIGVAQVDPPELTPACETIYPLLTYLFGKFAEISGFVVMRIETTSGGIYIRKMVGAALYAFIQCELIRGDANAAFFETMPSEHLTWD